MPLNRRELLRLVGACTGAFTVTNSTFANSITARPFKAATAQKPLRLCFNENALGMSDAAKQAASQAISEQASLYPFVRCEALRKACATFMGGEPENIVLTHGSAEAIRASIESHIVNDTQLVIPELTYSDGEDCARRNGIKVTKVPMGQNLSIDINGLKEAVIRHRGFSIVYFVNPNNPTSTICDSKELNAWIRSKPANTFFVIDEAYGEFADSKQFISAKTLVDEGFENLTVLKTFSKIFAMAGMRIGFSYANPKTSDKIRSQVAYDVMLNIAAVEAALAEINDKNFIEMSRKENADARKLVCKALDQLGIRYLPSQTNFIFMELKGSLTEFSEHMKAEHILVGRPFPPATQWCRISLGTVEDMHYFVQKLHEFRTKNWI